MPGQQIDAQEALKTGLIDSVIPPDKLMTAALEMANLMSQAAPLTIRAVKEGMLKGYDMTLEEGLINEGRLSPELQKKVSCNSILIIVYCSLIIELFSLMW